AVLVVTCPCALSLATPTALTVAMTSMAKKGFLVVKQHVCDSITQIQYIIFDKTGTLNENRIIISEVVVKHANKKKILSIAKSLEQLANHPIAQAIVNHFPSIMSLPLSKASCFPSLGVEGYIENTVYRIGQIEFVQ